VGAQNFNLILKFVEKGSALSFIILDKIFGQKFSYRLKFREGNCAPQCHWQRTPVVGQ